MAHALKIESLIFWPAEPKLDRNNNGRCDVGTLWSLLCKMVSQD